MANQNLRQAVPFFMVENMDRSIKFYLEGLGFQIKFEWTSDGKTKWCWLDRESVAVMLQEYQKDQIPQMKLGVGVSICIVCQDAMALYKEFLEKGLKPGEPFVGNNMWVISLSDPDGYRLDFESNTDVPEGTTYSDWTRQNQR